MSYGIDKGHAAFDDAFGTYPWTMAQRVAMFTAYFSLRRKIPCDGLGTNCWEYPVFTASGSSPYWKPRSAATSRRDTYSPVLKAWRLTRQADEIFETLKRVCSY